MSEPDDVWEWKQEGRLSVWRFHINADNYEGWHLNGDVPACSSLVDLIERMSASRHPTWRKLLLVPECPRPILNARWSATRALTIAFPQRKTEPNYWELLPKGDELTLTLGHSKLRELHDAIAEVALCDGYAIGPDVDLRKTEGKNRWNRECLWIWA